jgi:hypothetical protein
MIPALQWNHIPSPGSASSHTPSNQFTPAISDVAKVEILHIFHMRTIMSPKIYFNNRLYNYCYGPGVRPVIKTFTFGVSSVSLINRLIAAAVLPLGHLKGWLY